MRDTFPNKCLSLFFHEKPPIFDYLSHQSKYIRCGPLYLFKTSSYLYVKSLYVLPWIWLTTISIN